MKRKDELGESFYAPKHSLFDEMLRTGEFNLEFPKSPIRVDIMTDIETLGTKTESQIIQIAAVAFNIDTGELLKTYDRKIRFNEDDNPNITMGTLSFWAEKNPELFIELITCKAAIPEKEVVKEFHTWLCDFYKESNQVYLWGNGILFDNKKLEYLFNSNGYSYPIHFRSDRDVRTIVDLACMKSGLTLKELKEQVDGEYLVKHDAFDDCRWQIKLVQHCMKILDL